MSQALRQRSEELPAAIKAALLVGIGSASIVPGELYAKAQNLRPLLRAGYDRALESVDFLVAPTMPLPALEHVDPVKTPLSERILRGWSGLTNTPQTDMTGHPALSMPAAAIGSLPAGVMVIGRHFADADILELAAHYERAFGWQPRPMEEPWRG